jgi:hypothetical protein
MEQVKTSTFIARNASTPQNKRQRDFWILGRSDTQRQAVISGFRSHDLRPINSFLKETRKPRGGLRIHCISHHIAGLRRHLKRCEPCFQRHSPPPVRTTPLIAKSVSSGEVKVNSTGKCKAVIMTVSQVRPTLCLVPERHAAPSAAATFWATK